MAADVKVMAIDEMEPIFDGIARRARAALGVTGWGMQVLSLPPDWDGYPNHAHGLDVMVVSIVGNRLAAIAGFPQRADLYPRIGLPTTLGAPPAPPGSLERNGEGVVGAD